MLASPVSGSWRNCWQTSSAGWSFSSCVSVPSPWTQAPTREHTLHAEINPADYFVTDCELGGISCRVIILLPMCMTMMHHKCSFADRYSFKPTGEITSISVSLLWIHPIFLKKMGHIRIQVSPNNMFCYDCMIQRDGARSCGKREFVCSVAVSIRWDLSLPLYTCMWFWKLWYWRILLNVSWDACLHCL
jgi:hypothetical protein